MLSSSERNKLMDAINTAFAKIGKSNGTKMPSSSSNLDPIAWDLFVAQHINALATKRKDAAEKAATKADVIPDKEKNPQPPGPKVTVYEGDILEVFLEVRKSSNRVDATAMFNYLQERGVALELLSAAMAQATTVTRPAHVFSSKLRASGD